jgi:hypothetical protein
LGCLTVYCNSNHHRFWQQLFWHHNISCFMKRSYKDNRQLFWYHNTCCLPEDASQLFPHHNNMMLTRSYDKEYTWQLFWHHIIF